MIKLREITLNNFEDVLKLEVSEDQKSFVSTTVYSLAQAYVCRENVYPFAIYADNTPVGFIMFGYYEARSQYTLWKLLIDKKYQNLLAIFLILLSFLAETISTVACFAVCILPRASRAQRSSQSSEG